MSNLNGNDFLKGLKAVALKTLLVTCFCLPHNAYATDPKETKTSTSGSKVLAYITPEGGTKIEITEMDLARANADIGMTMRNISGNERAAYLLNYVIDSTIVAQAAQKAKMMEDPEFALSMNYYRNKVLMELMLTQITQKAVTEEAIKNLYAETSKKYETQQEVRVRHILLSTKEAAMAALKRAQKKESFEKLAKELSKDPNTKDQGGDLGYFTKDRMIPKFAEAVFAADLNKVSGPVETEFGFHVFLVEDKRKAKIPPIEELRKQLALYLIQVAQANYTQELRKKTKIELTEAAPKVDTPADSTAVPEKTP